MFSLLNENNNNKKKSNNDEKNTNNGGLVSNSSTNITTSISTSTAPFPTNMLKNLLENSELLDLLLKPISGNNNGELNLNTNNLDTSNSNSDNTSNLIRSTSTVSTTSLPQLSTQIIDNNNNSPSSSSASLPTTPLANTDESNNNNNNTEGNPNDISQDDDIALKLRDLSTFDLTDEELNMFFKEDKLECDDSQFSGKVYGNEFLGPSLWDKTDLFPSDKFGFKFECMELDDVLTENSFGMSKNELLDELNKIENEHQQQQQQQQKTNDTTTTTNSSTVQTNNNTSGVPVVSNSSISIVKNNNNNNPVNTLAKDTLWQTQNNNNNSNSVETTSDFLINSLFKPTTSSPSKIDKPTNDNQRQNNNDFSFFGPIPKDINTEELRARLKKNRKQQIIPTDMKDDRYWVRRRKNNLAAKRSRDAKRIRENQITLRAAFLERENDSLKKQLDQFKNESKLLKLKLMHYEAAAMQQSLFNSVPLTSTTK